MLWQQQMLSTLAAFKLAWMQQRPRGRATGVEVHAGLR
jgi:hypothetical protein